MYVCPQGVIQWGSGGHETPLTSYMQGGPKTMYHKANNLGLCLMITKFVYQICVQNLCTKCVSNHLANDFIAIFCIHYNSIIGHIF